MKHSERNTVYEGNNRQYIKHYLYPAKFWIFAQDCGGNFHRGCAVLIDLIIKLRPWANFPWGVNRSPSQFLVGGRGTALENIHWSYVWFQFVMPNSLNVSSWLLMKGFLAPICLAIRLCQDVRSGRCSLEFSA